MNCNDCSGLLPYGCTCTGGPFASNCSMERNQRTTPVLTDEPPIGLLVSMAIRADHALGIPGYYDQPMMLAAHGVTHAQMLQSTMNTMRQLWEEVAGKGFYRPEKEAEYAAILAATKQGADKETK